MLCRIKKSQSSVSLTRGIRRMFSKSSNFTLLYPSKTPIVPFQTFVTTMKESDRNTIQKLNIKETAAFYMNSEESRQVPEDIMKLIQEAKEETVRMQTEDQKNSSKKKQTLLPKQNPTKKEFIMGQGIAVTLDDNFQEFLNHGEKAQEPSPFSSVNNINEVHTIGSICKLNITNQSMHNNKRILMTLEGQDKVRLYRELADNEIFEFLERSREERVKDLKEKYDNVIRLKQHSQYSEFNHETLKA